MGNFEITYLEAGNKYLMPNSNTSFTLNQAWTKNTALSDALSGKQHISRLENGLYEVKMPGKPAAVFYKLEDAQKHRDYLSNKPSVNKPVPTEPIVLEAKPVEPVKPKAPQAQKVKLQGYTGPFKPEKVNLNVGQTNAEPVVVKTAQAPVTPEQAAQKVKLPEGHSGIKRTPKINPEGLKYNPAPKAKEAGTIGKFVKELEISSWCSCDCRSWCIVV